jgi:hypothetical protein
LYHPADSIETVGQRGAFGQFDPIEPSQLIVMVEGGVAGSARVWRGFVCDPFAGAVTVLIVGVFGLLAVNIDYY